MSAYSPIKAVDRSRDCFLKLPEVIARTALSRTSIYRKVDRGEFPKPQRLGANSVAWYESDVIAWIEAPLEWKAAA